MNSSKGVVTHSDFLNTEVDAIVRQIKGQGVIDVYHKTKFVNKRTGTPIIRIFAGAVLPKKFRIGYGIKECRPMSRERNEGNSSESSLSTKVTETCVSELACPQPG